MIQLYYDDSEELLFRAQIGSCLVQKSRENYKVRSSSIVTCHVNLL